MKTINKASSNQIDNNRSRTFITGKIRELARNVVEIEDIAYFQHASRSSPQHFHITPLNRTPTTYPPGPTINHLLGHRASTNTHTDPLGGTQRDARPGIPRSALLSLSSTHPQASRAPRLSARCGPIQEPPHCDL